MLKTFKMGGVHPPENKISANSPIEVLPLPETVTIPISQHIGVPSQILVQKNDKVKVGTLIAKQNGFVSANIHSSVSGTVQKLKRCSIHLDTAEWLSQSQSRAMNGRAHRPLDRPEERLRHFNRYYTKDCRGWYRWTWRATFPAHVKLTVPQGKKAEILIINGVECEPYLTSDHRLMLERDNEIMIGTSILMKALNVSDAAIGIENNKPDAIKN